MYDENRAGARVPKRSLRTFSASQPRRWPRLAAIALEADPLAYVEKQAARDWGVGSPQSRWHLAYAAWRCPWYQGALVPDPRSGGYRRCEVCRFDWYPRFRERDGSPRPDSMIVCLRFVCGQGSRTPRKLAAPCRFAARSPGRTRTRLAFVDPGKGHLRPDSGHVARGAVVEVVAG